MLGTYRNPAETGFYYLNTRHYELEIGRFINADNQVAGIGGDILGYNLFAYCYNNPVNMSDCLGQWPQWIKNTVKMVSNAIEKVVNTATNIVNSIVASASNRRPNNGERGPAYTEVLQPILGVALVTACAIGIKVAAVDDATGIGVADDFLFGPLGTGIGQGSIMIFK